MFETDFILTCADVGGLICSCLCIVGFIGYSAIVSLLCLFHFFMLLGFIGQCVGDPFEYLRDPLLAQPFSLRSSSFKVCVSTTSLIFICLMV